MVGRSDAVDVFRFQLAELLHKTLEEVDRMTQAEYLGWAAYLEAKAAYESVHRG